jgi:DNA-binding NtrC family response regulator
MLTMVEERTSLVDLDLGTLHGNGVDMLNKELVLIIGAEGESRKRIIAATHKCGLGSVTCSTLDDARFLLAKQNFKSVFCSDTLPDGDFRGIIRAAGSIPVIVLSRLAEWEPYLIATNAGAFDYIACPPDPVETGRILWFALHESSRLHRIAQAAA